jgi:hypothetical protein
MVGLFVATGGLLFGYDTGWVDCRANDGSEETNGNAVQSQEF